MKLSRDWFTPLTTGAFVLLAVTGVLLFFHFDTGLNKLAHEWLSWVLLAAAAGHVATNFGALKRHLAGTRGRAIIGAFALLLGLSFMPLGRGEAEPPFAGVVHALARAPLPAVAQVVGVSEPVLRERLLAAGVQVEDSQGSIEAAVGPGLRPQVRALRAAVAAAAPTR
jgi:4-amino-4-deoxy-L-arabinose transferase-like glycosyltransferase